MKLWKMKKKLISILNEWNNIIKVSLDLNNVCPFKCYYCDNPIKNDQIISLSNEDMVKFLYFLIKLNKIKKNLKIMILIWWWEPFTYKNLFFFLEKIFSLNIENLEIQVLTNWYLISQFEDKLIEFYDKFKIKPKLKFFVSYHFAQYEKSKWTQNYIDWINILKKIWFKFKINFIMPDEFELKYFVKIKDLIIKECNLIYKDYVINLIMDWTKFSKYYKKEILEYYYNYKSTLEDEPNLIHNFILNFDDWTNEKFVWSFFKFKDHIIKNWFHKVSWFFCNPFSNYMAISITPKLDIFLGICKTLLKKPYTIETFLQALSDEKLKFIDCEDEFCWCCDTLFLDKFNSKLISKDEANKIYKSWK